jgi:hypothetical protein
MRGDRMSEQGQLTEEFILDPDLTEAFGAFACILLPDSLRYLIQNAVQCYEPEDRFCRSTFNSSKGCQQLRIPPVPLSFVMPLSS